MTRSLGYVVDIKKIKTKGSIYVSKVIFMCDRGGVPRGLETLKVENDEDNHEPEMYMEGHPYVRWLTCDNCQILVKSKSNKVNKSNRSAQLTLVY
uniref:Uncharacterized protein n=1 Tax=Lactuca sativa TaxID=4236 RepID=A0A9R1UWL1_LACSA|nr:hypothetical protein LSAT_V11C800438670 [Lactuca sativa]